MRRTRASRDLGISTLHGHRQYITLSNGLFVLLFTQSPSIANLILHFGKIVKCLLHCCASGYHPTLPDENKSRKCAHSLPCCLKWSRSRSSQMGWQVNLWWEMCCCCCLCVYAWFEVNQTTRSAERERESAHSPIMLTNRLKSPSIVKQSKGEFPIL